MKKIIFFILLIVVFFYACKENEETKDRNWKKIDEQLININKYLVNEDKERIESYIERKQWKMEQTETGLWYEIVETGKGEKAQQNQIAVINYKVELLDGTLCYSSDSTGPKSFKVGMEDVENGLHEGIKMLNKGAKARFIMPPYLAHGLVGDDYKIPPRSIIVYYVELIDIKKKFK